MHYSELELEALAIVSVTQHFSPYLYGRRFKVYTDHQALTSLLTSKVLSPRLFRFAQKLQTWDMQIIYKPGEENGGADSLSRQDLENREILDERHGAKSDGGERALRKEITNCG